MGQAAINLPDPLAKPLASSVSADDLLSQLAGEEIDRLLAAQDDAAPVAEEGKDFVKVFGPDGVRQASLPPKSSNNDERTAPATQPLNEHATERTTVTEEQPPVVTAEPVTAPEDSSTSPAERSALDGVAELLEEQSRGDGADQSESLPRSAPLYVKPLEWINAPLLLLPESAREIIGKIAILTFVNAIAVLVYVLVFRKAH
jgi:hypothetical protein